MSDIEAGMRMGANLGLGAARDGDPLGNAMRMAQDMYGMEPGEAYVKSKHFPEADLLKALQLKADLTEEEQAALDYLMKKLGAKVPEFGQMQPAVDVPLGVQAGEIARDAHNAAAQKFGRARETIADKKGKFLDWWNSL